MSFVTTLSNYRQRCQFKKKAKHQTRTQKKAICLCCKNERAWCYTARRQFNKNLSTTPRTHNKTHADTWLLRQTLKKMPCANWDHKKHLSESSRKHKNRRLRPKHQKQNLSKVEKDVSDSRTDIS